MLAELDEEVKAAKYSELPRFIFHAHATRGRWLCGICGNLVI